MTVPRLAVAGLGVAYGTARVVDRFDLAVAPGEVVALLGPSGSGKSTILRAIAGLVAPETGTIELDGRSLAGVPPDQREIGLMFQDYALFPHRDVGGNVAFGPRMHGLGRAQVGERVADVLELVGLGGFERRAITSLSGGEQQRVALARALAPSPRALLLDEPLGSLDRSLRERLTIELRELFTRLGSTVITVTHDQGEAFTLADRVVLLRDGRLVQSGAPLAVWRTPADAWAARFLGFANVLSIVVSGGEAVTPWGAVPTDRPDGAAALVIRPAALRIAGGAAVRAVASAARFRGDHVAVPVTTDDGVVLEVIVRDGGVPAAGTSVSLAVDVDDVVVVAP